MPEPKASSSKDKEEKVAESSDRVIPKNPDLGVAQLRFLVALHDNPKRAENLKDLLAAVHKYEMGPFYELLCEDSTHVAKDAALLAGLKAANKKKLAAFDVAIAAAVEREGESEIREAYQAKAEYLSQIGAKDEALSALRAAFEKTVGSGNRIDNVFHQIRLGLFFTDHDLITANLSKAKELMEAGGDWDRKNRLKAYEGLYLASIRDFAGAAPLFLEAVPTFTATELLSYKELVFYTVVVGVFALDRPELRAKLVGSAEVSEQLFDQGEVKAYLHSIYDCRYADFFRSLAWLEGQLKADRYLHPSYSFYVVKMRQKAYAQLLSSYSSLSLVSMATQFGVTKDFIEKELYRMIVAGELHCRMDSVSGIVETSRLDGKNYQFQALIRKSDALLNRVQKLSRIINV